MFLRNPFAGAFGLEIGDLSVKLVQLERSFFHRRKYLRVKEMRQTELPSGLIVNGEIQQPELVRKKILHLLGRDNSKNYKPIKSPWVVVGLPEPKTFLKLLEIPTTARDLTEVEVVSEAQKHIPFDEPANTYLDWKVVHNKEESVEVLVAAADKVTADAYTYLLESVYLNPLALEVEAISLARAMVTAEKDYTGQARAILDLGATRSSLVIYDKDTIQFSTSLNYSGEIVNTALQQGMKIDREQAEKIKRANGLQHDSRNRKYLRIVTDLNEKLIAELQSALSFYQERFTEQNQVELINMCGGVSNWQGLDEFIARKLEIPASPGHPWKNLANPSLGSNSQENQRGRSLAVAIGLALKAAKKPF